MTLLHRLKLSLLLAAINVHGTSPEAPADCSAPQRPSAAVCGSSWCYHGDCETELRLDGGAFVTATSCICDWGWWGEKCDVCCDLPCIKTQGTCDLSNGMMNKTFCSCYDGFTGEFCSERTEQGSIDPQSSEDPGTSSIMTTSDCSAAQRPAPRMCGVFLCHNGDCQSSLEMVDGEYDLVQTCICDSGWWGEKCDVCCDLPCVDTQGRCDLVDGMLNETFCACYGGFSGELCSVRDEFVFPVTMRESTDIMDPLPPSNPHWMDIGTAGRASGETCNGEPVVDILPTDCYGLDCYHGTCERLEEDGENEFGFNCNCHPAWVGTHCNDCCDIPCNNGTCTVSHSGEMYCICENSNFTASSNCTAPPPTDAPPTVIIEQTPDWLWHVVGTGAALFLILILLPVLLLYYFWRKRYLFMMKLVYFFQKYDESDRLFDVFISYRSFPDDEAFVVHKLHPKLEAELGMRVCVHYRDFMPGESIADNILWAVKNSARSILVITPDFCQGEWPRFEVQAAQKEMLDLRHKIVPVIFKDIREARQTKELDSLLEHILDSVTYLEWPGEGDEGALNQFWARLKFAMPKIKPKRKTETGDAPDNEIEEPTNQLSAKNSQNGFKTANQILASNSQSSFKIDNQLPSNNSQSNFQTGFSISSDESSKPLSDYTYDSGISSDSAVSSVEINMEGWTFNNFYLSNKNDDGVLLNVNELAIVP